MGVCGIGGFLQIQTSAKRRAGSAQNQNALIRLLRRDVNGRTEFSQQLDSKRVPTLWPIERHHTYLRRFFFD
jgi:hypothetical protein